MSACLFSPALSRTLLGGRSCLMPAQQFNTKWPEHPVALRSPIANPLLAVVPAPVLATDTCTHWSSNFGCRVCVCVCVQVARCHRVQIPTRPLFAKGMVCLSNDRAAAMDSCAWGEQVFAIRRSIGLRSASSSSSATSQEHQTFQHAVKQRSKIGSGQL